jgi:hypothetical protein
MLHRRLATLFQVSTCVPDFMPCLPPLTHLQRTGFVAFVKSSQDSRHINYSWSWNELVAEYFNVRIVASDDPVDRCPILNMSIGEPENRMGSLEEMVYLRRCIDKVPGEDQESQALPLPVTSTAGPSMKKRKLITGLAALMDMM